MPWLKRFEQALDARPAAARRTRRLLHRIQRRRPAACDQSSRYEAYAKGRQWGWLSVNDIRRLENLPPVPGGDIYLQPLNMVPAGSTPELQP
jgi:phage portal protein BeeE